jgi:hypothetical protein
LQSKERGEVVEEKGEADRLAVEKSKEDFGGAVGTE